MTDVRHQVEHNHDFVLGTWIIDVPGMPKSLVPSTFTINDFDGALTGHFRSSFGTVPLENVLVDGASVRFDTSICNGPLATSSGVFASDQLLLRLGFSGAPDFSLPARRATCDEIAQWEAARPARFDLPDLVDLPPNGLALTPPMGWNSWNKFGKNISDQIVRETAQAMATSGLKDAGYAYITIDDGWQGVRDENGLLQPNEHFPNMADLANYVHSLGLKFGIYSSPGPITCSGFVGSYGHEADDARQFAEWGVDFLKYDWCSAGEIYHTKFEMQAAYQRMAQALRDAGRPIVYSVCQYGLLDVGEWAPAAGANLWRTSGDIWDRWDSMIENGLERSGCSANAKPGQWNDPDMLEIGNGGMSLEEYRTHMSIWAILAAPLFLGNDLRSMTHETAAILTNPAVISLNQDSQGQQGKRVGKIDRTEIWMRPLEGGRFAVGFFNLSDGPSAFEIALSGLGIFGCQNVRDIWIGEDLGAQAAIDIQLLSHHSKLFVIG